MAAKHFKEAPSTADVAPQKAVAPKSAQPKKKNKSSLASRFLTFFGVALLIVAAFLFARDAYKYKKLDWAIEEQQTYVKVVDENQPPVIDWAQVKQKYPDVVGWIYVPGTVINYPIVQGRNNDLYLNTLPDGSYNAGGSIFLDAENIAPGMIDQHTILYGHHMKNGTMFKRIADMQSQEIFDSVKSIWYLTEHKSYELQPVFFYITNGSDAELRTIDFPNHEAYDEFFIHRIQDDKPHLPNAQQVIKESDRILSLSTCNYDVEDGRAELVCAWKDPDKPAEQPENADESETTTQSE